MSYHGLGLNFAVDLSQALPPVTVPITISTSGQKVAPVTVTVVVPTAVRQAQASLAGLRDQLSAAMASGNLGQVSVLKPGLAAVETMLATRLSQWATLARTANSQALASLVSARGTSNATIIAAAQEAANTAQATLNAANSAKATAVTARAETLSLVTKAEAMAVVGTLEKRLATAIALYSTAEAALAKAYAAGDASRSRLAKASFDRAKAMVAELQTAMANARAVVDADRLAREQAERDAAARDAEIAERVRLSNIENQRLMAEQAARDTATRKEAAEERAAQVERDRLAQEGTQNSFSYEPDVTPTPDDYSTPEPESFEDRYGKSEQTELAPDTRPLWQRTDMSRPECMRIPPAGDCWLAPCPSGTERGLVSCDPIVRGEGILPKQEIPWLWIGLGTAGVGVVGYLIYHRSVK